MAQWRNRCVSDGYEPGSTFKLITLASALDSGAVTLNDSFYCGGQEKFTGREQILNCWKSAGHGAQTTAQALGNSCNIAFGHIGLRMGGDTFYDYLKSFGIMEKTGVDLPGEASGLFYERKDARLTRQTTAHPTSSPPPSARASASRPCSSCAPSPRSSTAAIVLEPYIVSEVAGRGRQYRREKRKDRPAAGHQPADVRDDAHAHGAGRHRGHGRPRPRRPATASAARPARPKSSTNMTRTASRSRTRSSPSSALRRSTTRNTSSLSRSIPRPIRKTVKNTPSTACISPAA